MELTDTSPIPFGKHKGTPMQDVPVDYLHYLWEHGLQQRRTHHKGMAVSDYIRKSLNALKLENPDLIWS